MATPIKDIKDLNDRVNKARDKYQTRDQLVQLCDEMYLMKADRASAFLSPQATAWRNRVAPEYWESCNKAQNVVDIMHSVLAGHDPMWKCTIPGNISSTVPSRAEMFLSGAFRLNSLRQQKNLVSKIIFKMVKHGSVAVRVTWMADPPPVTPAILPHPDSQEEGEQVVVQLHDEDTFPICIDAIDIRNIYLGARGSYGRPFSEIFYVQQRSVEDVLMEWEGRGDTKKITEKIGASDRAHVRGRYVEWWGQDNMGTVHYAIAFDDHFIIKPTETDYPAIPFVILFYKEGDDQNPSYEHLPFLYPIIWALDKMEYVRSRAYRQIDMFANMNPYHSGATPISGLDATWGKIIELGEREKIEFPNWPGQPPDVYREMQQLEDEMSEGTFSSAMFGKLSARVSGYALSQVIGADTLRTDTPRRNLEMGLTAVSTLVFKLMRTKSRPVYLGVTAQVNNKKMTAILSGDETRQLVTEAFIKPKQTSDEIRLATLGAQIAAQPDPPVSLRYILENFFGVSQPEEELARKLDEAAMKDPIIKLMAMHEVLEATGSPYAPIIMGQLQAAIGQAAAPEGQGSPQIGMGLGIPQNLAGNMPFIPGSGNPSEEVGPQQQTELYGGPTEERPY